MTEDEQFVADFEACHWPMDKWHHRDHIKLAYLYLRRYPLEEASRKISTGIRAHNASHKIPDTPTGGYHETMTQAWLRLVHFTICEWGSAENADLFADLHPELSQKNILRLYYSRERFMSPEAKSGFLEPDLAPFPISKKPTS